MSAVGVDDLARVLDETDRMVAAIAADQWDAATPCTEWTVRALVDHMVGGNLLFAAALRGDEPRAVDRGNMVRAFRAAAADVVAGFRLPGVLERTVTVPFGEVPGALALNLRTTEIIVHGWDLARAIDATPDFPAELVERQLDFTRVAVAQVPPDRAPFGPPQPVADDAPALDQLVALLGRTV